MEPTPLYESEFYRIERLEPHPVVKLTRLPKPFMGREDVERACRPIQQVFNRVGRKLVQLLIDSRKVVGRNDPTSEANFLFHRREMVQGFARVAILVETPTGKLHAQRLLVEDGTSSLNVRVFMNEEEAMSFLTAPPSAR